jgi:hypothetical protein
LKGFKYQKETCVARNTKLKKKSSHLSSITTTQDTTIKNLFLFEVFRTSSPTSLISIIVKHLLYFYTRREIFLLQNYKGKFKNLLLMPGLECSWYKRRWFQQTLHGWAEAWRWVLGYFTDNYQAYSWDCHCVPLWFITVKLNLKGNSGIYWSDQQLHWWCSYQNPCKEEMTRHVIMVKWI